MSMQNFESLDGWGWNTRLHQRWNEILEEGGDRTRLIPARVVHHAHHFYDCVTDERAGSTFERLTVSGRFQHRAAVPSDYPTAGDWVVVDQKARRIEYLLPRTSAFTRKVAGEQTVEQVIVANIDYVFIVFGLDGGRNFVVSLVERSLTAAWNSGAQPVIVLNKVDTTSPEERIGYQIAAEEVAAGSPVHLVSAITGVGLDELEPYLKPGRTIGLIGKSGVGKSALTNALGGLPTDTRGKIAATVGEIAATGVQRNDLQGRHTTTSKRLYRLPGGAVIADLPGLRELQLWGDESSLGSAFPEIDALATECRFRDCSHENEPGCAVRAALEEGTLDASRYDHYLNLRKELKYLERRTDHFAARQERDKWRQINKNMRTFYKNNPSTH